MFLTLILNTVLIFRKLNEQAEYEDLLKRGHVGRIHQPHVELPGEYYFISLIIICNTLALIFLYMSWKCTGNQWFWMGFFGTLATLTVVQLVLLIFYA